MSIIRGPRPEANYYTLDKRISEDVRLGWAARGLLIYLLGKPDNWKVSVMNLRKQTAAARIPTGRDGVYALLRELEAVGYVRFEQKRSADGKGFGEIDYLVSETVLPAQADTRHADTPHADTAETTLTSTEEATRIEGKTKTESINNAQAEGALPRTLEVKDLQWPEHFDLEQEIVEDFWRHCRDLGKPLTTSAWKHTCQDLQKFWDNGVDLNQSLVRTMQTGKVIPVDPTRGKDVVIEKRQQAQRRRTDQSVRWAERAQPPSSPDREGAWNAH